MFEQSIRAFAGITLIEILAFLVPFIVAVMIDLRSHRRGQSITMGDAAIWSGIWVVCALTFGSFIYWSRGIESASLYLTGYVLEKALAVDRACPNGIGRPL